MGWTELYINSFYMEEPKEDDFEIIAQAEAEDSTKDADKDREKI